jgi:hypothetical protein
MQHAWISIDHAATQACLGVRFSSLSLSLTVLQLLCSRIQAQQSSYSLSPKLSHTQPAYRPQLCQPDVPDIIHFILPPLTIQTCTSGLGEGKLLGI